MDLGSYDGANLHDRLLEYHLSRPAIVVQQKPDETIDGRVLDIQRLAYRAFNKDFTPKKIISQLKDRQHKSEFYSKLVDGIPVNDEFILDSDGNLIAGIRYRPIENLPMTIEKIIYLSAQGIGVVLMYNTGVPKLDWENPRNVVGIRLDINGNFIRDLRDLR